jgi:CBS domain-containing protein
LPGKVASSIDPFRRVPVTDCVRTFVHRPPVDVLADATLRDLARTLSDESVGVAVVRGSGWRGAGRTASGVVSERDLTRAIADGDDPDVTRVGEIMTDDFASTSPGTSIRDAARQMLDNEVRHLLVVDGDIVVGVISMRDVLAAMIEGGDGT